MRLGTNPAFRDPSGEERGLRIPRCADTRNHRARWKAPASSGSSPTPPLIAMVSEGSLPHVPDREPRGRGRDRLRRRERPLKGGLFSLRCEWCGKRRSAHGEQVNCAKEEPAGDRPTGSGGFGGDRPGDRTPPPASSGVQCVGPCRRSEQLASHTSQPGL